MMSTVEDIPVLLDKIFSLCGKEARGWVIDLAAVLNRTEPCKRCNGAGWHEKHRGCTHPVSIRYERGCGDVTVCGKCKGGGRIMKAVQP